MDTVHETPIKFLCWIITTVIGIFLCKVSFKRIYFKNNPENTCWGRWVNFNYDDEKHQWYYQVAPMKMSEFQKTYDYTQIIRDACIIFFFGNIINKIHLDQPAVILYAFPMVFMIFFFGFLGQCKGMNITITPWSLSHLSPQAKVWLTLVTILMGTIVGVNSHIAHTNGVLGWYLTGVFCVPVFYYYLYWVYLKEDPKPRWHVHHWFIGFYWTMVCYYDIPFNNIVAMGFYGVSLQGAVSFGCTPIITASGEYDTLAED